MSLHNMIKQDAHALDETSKQRLQRHLQKLANARPNILCRTYPPSGSKSILDHNEQRSQSSPIDQVSSTREGEGDEL